MTDAKTEKGKPKKEKRMKKQLYRVRRIMMVAMVLGGLAFTGCGKDTKTGGGGKQQPYGDDGKYK